MRQFSEIVRASRRGAGPRVVTGFGAAAVLFAVSAPGAVPTPQRIVAGPWSALIGPVGPESVAYKGRPFWRKGRIAGFKPGWKGDRFDLSGAELTVRGGTAVWKKKVAGDQEATLRLVLRPEAARLELDTAITAAGPSEFSIQIVPEAVRATSEQCFCRVNGNLQNLPLGRARFEPVGRIRDLRFEQPERTITVRADGFQLQDRRSWKAGLYLVKVIGSDGREPRRYRTFIEVAVREATPEQVPGRRRLVSQRLWETHPVRVVNPGFEAAGSLEGWSKNPLAAADREQHRGGRCAARLAITGEPAQRGHVYLTQNVPVKPGQVLRASAWVRTREVKAAALAGMSPTGATVILEFADPKGQWYAPGNYAKGLYATRGWTRVATKPVRVPEGAGFAIIFLALRGLGTAWFDDVALTEVRDHVVLLEPLADTAVPDNTPAFCWTLRPKAPGIVDLSRDPTFPPNATQSLPPSDDSRATVVAPLPPGKWFWRVRVPEYAVTSRVWGFRQTASLDQDTTPPRIVAGSCYLAAPRQAVRFRCMDNQGVTSVSLRLDGRDVSAAVRVRDGVAEYVPEQNWTDGLHVAEAAVRDAAGNTARTTFFFTHSPPLSTIAWERHGGVAVDGRKHFLLGMYGVRTKDMPEIANGGFDFIHNYRWDGSGTDAEALEYLDAARRHGLRVFIGFDRRRLMAGDDAFVARRVGALMAHPALLAWYLYDEPDLEHQFVSPKRLKHYHDFIQGLDPFHPIVVTCAGDAAVPRYRAALDVHWTQVYGSTAFVARRLERHREALGAEVPIAAILHCYDRAQTGIAETGAEPDPDRFQPDAATMRANAFMAVVHGSSGLVWWWWGQGSPRFYTVAQVPAAWKALRRTVADIKALEPWLTADAAVRRWTVPVADGKSVLYAWLKRRGKRALLITVLRDRVPAIVEIAPPGLPPDAELEVRFEHRRVKLRDGRFAERFEPLGVHVYEFQGR